MTDYFNMMIEQPDEFIEFINTNEDYRSNNEELNKRRYAVLDGTLLHLAVMGLLGPSNVIAFDDDTALKLVFSMINQGACPLIENIESKIPYELFHLYNVNPNEYQTYRYLLAQTTSSLLAGTCVREFYEDYSNDRRYYNFDRTYE